VVCRFFIPNKKKKNLGNNAKYAKSKPVKKNMRIKDEIRFKPYWLRYLGSANLFTNARHIVALGVSTSGVQVLSATG
jgi:hypothetical protein